MSGENIGEDYYNQVIYVECMRYPGRWLDASHEGWALYTEAPQSEVIEKIWARWIVRKGPDNSVVLESVRYSNRFLDAHHSTFCHITYSSYPYDEDWALWFMEKTADGNVCLRSKRYPESRLDANHLGSAGVTKDPGVWHEMQIYRPEIREQKEVIFTCDNTDGTDPVQTSYTETIGIIKTKSMSEIVSSEMGMEIKNRFTAKASITDWTMSSSATWNTQQSRTVKVTVEPGSKKVVSQLVGYYGSGTEDYKVLSSNISVEE